MAAPPASPAAYPELGRIRQRIADLTIAVGMAARISDAAGLRRMVLYGLDGVREDIEYVRRRFDREATESVIDRSEIVGVKQEE